MMRKFLLLSLVCGALGLTGCTASKFSTVVTEPVTTVIEENQAQAGVVFLRDTLLGSMISAPLAYYQEELNDYHYLGVLNAFETTFTMVKPGKYVFVVGGQRQHAAKVEIEGGKLYALHVIPVDAGGWKAGFDFRKMDMDDDFIKQVKTYRRTTVSEQGLTRVAPKMEKKVDLIKKNGAPKDFLLKPDDGMPFAEFKVLFDKAPAK